MTRMKTKIINNSTQKFAVKEGLCGVYHYLTSLFPKGTYILYYDPNQTYREYVLVGSASIRMKPVITSDDCADAAEITIYESFEQTTWRVSKARGELQQPQRPSYKIQELAAFHAVGKDASSRIETIETFYATLEKLLTQVKICPLQCENLVQMCLKVISQTKGTYSMVSDMWQLYYAGKLPHLVSSLDRFISTLGSTEDLLQACGRQWGKMGLVVSIPLPPPGKKTCSKFDLLIKELSWNLDTIYYALLLTKDMEFKWNENRCRYVREDSNLTGVAAAEEMHFVESESLVLQDRAHFLSHLEDGSLLTQENFFLHLAWQHLSIKFAADRSRDSFAAVLTKRLQVKEEELSSECSSVPECFWISHGDLKIKNKLSGDLERGSKAIFRGEWYNQEVAIAIVRGTEKVAVEREAAVMLKVQHPNIVDFLGCAFTDDAPPPASRDKNDNCTAGYLVMELMDEDLRRLITRCNRKRPGGPFPVAVVVDILLQIVGAMIHMHNCKIMYRDLKAANCLVSPKSPLKSNSQVIDFYSVKLIDFETSKMLKPEDAKSIHTLMKGTCRWMAPEVWKTRKDEHFAPYEKSADVFSFGMTCYEVISGLLPFHKYDLNSEIKSALDRGDRPLLPASVSCPKGLEELMSKCWAQDPKERPGFKNIEIALWTIKYELEIIQ